MRNRTVGARGLCGSGPCVIEKVVTAVALADALMVSALRNVATPAARLSKGIERGQGTQEYLLIAMKYHFWYVQL